MGKPLDHITPGLADWIVQQRLFFVATAPMAREGLVNCSPKGKARNSRLRSGCLV